VVFFCARKFSFNERWVTYSVCGRSFLSKGDGVLWYKERNFFCFGGEGGDFGVEVGWGEDGRSFYCNRRGLKRMGFLKLY